MAALLGFFVVVKLGPHFSSQPLVGRCGVGRSCLLKNEMWLLWLCCCGCAAPSAILLHLV